MAGCNCNKETYLTSYQDLTETTKAQHVDWSVPQIRREVAKIFRPQYRQNAESRKQELSGVKEYDGTDFTYSGPEGVRFKNGDGSMGLLEFHERQLRLTPKAYSEAQHQTSLLIDQAFGSGATEVATSYQEPGGQRDIVVMTLDRATGKGKMRIINTVSDHTMSEMQNLVKKTFTHLSEVRPATNVFILSDTNISKEQIQQKFSLLDQQIHAVIRETVGVAKNTFREIRYTTDSVRQFVKRSYDERLKAHPDVMRESFVQQMGQMFKHKEEKKEKILIAQYKPDQHRIVEKVRVKKREIQQIRRQVQEKIVASVATLLFVRATGVGIGGAFALLESIARLPQISLESPKRVKKEKQQRRKRALEKMWVFRKSEAFKKLTKKERRIFRREEKKLRVAENKLFLQKEQRKIRKKEIFFSRKEKVLWKMLKRLVQKTERQFLSKKIKQKEYVQNMSKEKKGKQIVLKQKERQTKKQERQHVIKFSIAVVLWLLLRPREKRQEVKVTKHEKLRKLVQKESAPWLLFAIIWHLAMIREQGQKTVYKQKKAKKQQTQHYPISMPPAGVIFAFAS